MVVIKSSKGLLLAFLCVYQAQELLHIGSGLLKEVEEPRHQSLRFIEHLKVKFLAATSDLAESEC
jgi:hypothetical protein